MSTIAERVAAGAAFLDREEPDWFTSVDVDTLELSDCLRCVLGQLHGEYVAALDWLEIDLADAIDLGFAEAARAVSQSDYPALTAEWKRVITERRATS